MAITSFVVVALAALPVQADSATPGLLALLESGQEVRALERVRLQPDAARETFAELFRLSVRSPDSGTRVQRLLQAGRLAELYQQAWSDSFFVRGVEQFTRWSPDERAEKLEADSLRLAGNEAYSTRGPEAAIRLWEQSLTRQRAVGDVAGQAAVLGNLGTGYFALGQLERALRYQTQALELAEAAGDHRTRGNALGNIASIHRYRGDLALAAEFYGRALEVRPLTGDRDGEVADLNNLALVRADLGDPRGAEQQFRRALAINRRDGRDGAAADNLTNLANLTTERGEYDDALVLYHDALDLRRRVGDRQGEALDLENVGLLHLRWGDYPAALESLEDALAILVETGPPTRRGEVRSDIAAVRAAMGELRVALETLDSADAEVGGDEHLMPLLALQRADLLADLNEYQHAAEFYERARGGYASLDDAWGQSEAEQGLGYLYMSREDFDVAEAAFIRALRVQETLADPRPAALTRILLGDAQSLNGDTAAARQTYNRALATHIALGDRAAEAMTLGAIARLDRKVGALAASAAGYRAALSRVEDSPVAPIRWQLRVGLGMTLRAQGLTDQAATELRAAIAQLEHTGATFTVEETRYRYFDDKWHAYAELARTELARGRPASAFEVSESLRARELLDLLARGRTSPESGSTGLIREEQTLRRRIEDLTDRAGATFRNQTQLRGAVEAENEQDALYRELLLARTEYERLLVRIKELHPDYASVVTGATVAARDVQQRLPDDAVLIEYLVSDEWTLAFVVSTDEVAAVELPVTRDRLYELIRFFRGTLGPQSSPTGDDLWRTPLRSLYQQLLAPLKEAGHFDGKRLLIIAPHGELHYLPFAALLVPDSNGETFLIESYDIAYVPSASVWAQLEQRRRPAPKRGILAMAPLPDAFARSAEEVRGITVDDPAADVVIGSAATEARFLRDAPDSRIVHLATAGVLNNRNPLFSYVQLNAGQQQDGRLEVHEVFDLSLSADLVVLSACETGLGTGARQEIPPGDDWVGLVRAFLFAGAESVVASLWPVEDDATAELMKRFYARLRDGSSKAEALGDAQRAFIRDSRRASPFNWAAFGLTGGVH